MKRFSSSSLRQKQSLRSKAKKLPLPDVRGMKGVKDVPELVEQSKAWPFWVLLLLAIVYAWAWVALACPYRFFPSDDRGFWTLMSHNSLDNFKASFEPSTEISMWLFFKVVKHILPETPSLMVVFSVACYVGIMGAVAFIARQTARNWFPALLAVALYAGSAWPVTYLFMASYTPWATLCIWVSWGLLVYSLLQGQKGYVPAICAGLAAVACLGASVSGAVAVLGIGCLAIMFRHPLTGRWRPGTTACFCITVMVGVGILWCFFGENYRAHIRENVASDHLRIAAACFGEKMSPPVFSGLWVLWNYSTVLATMFVGGSILVLAVSIRALLTKRPRTPGSLRPFLAALCMTTWLQMIAIDILPTTKLARAHFLWFPGACLFIALVIWWCANGLPTRHRRIGFIGAIIILACSAAEGAFQFVQVQQSRQALPAYLNRQHPGLGTVYLVTGDPHVPWLAAWLSQWQVVPITLQEVLARLSASQPQEMVLIVGPTGTGSGQSILCNGCLPDFPFAVEEFARQTGARLETLPYCAYIHAFCMEEEVCESLLYQKRIPNPAEDQNKNIRVLYWPASQRVGGGAPLPPVSPPRGTVSEITPRASPPEVPK